MSHGPRLHDCQCWNVACRRKWIDYVGGFASIVRCPGCGGLYWDVAEIPETPPEHHDVAR